MIKYSKFQIVLAAVVRINSTIKAVEIVQDHYTNYHLLIMYRHLYFKASAIYQLLQKLPSNNGSRTTADGRTHALTNFTISLFLSCTCNVNVMGD